VLYSICKVELLDFLHQGKNTDSGFSGNMMLRKLFRRTTFWEWGNGENYITRGFAIIYYQQVLFLAALQPISILGRLVLRFPDRTQLDTHTNTQTHSADRTPLNEGSASCKGRYIHNTRKRRISMHSVGFEPTIPVV